MKPFGSCDKFLRFNGGSECFFSSATIRRLLHHQKRISPHENFHNPHEFSIEENQSEIMRLMDESIVSVDEANRMLTFGGLAEEIF
jgi:hypothetical protein